MNTPINIFISYSHLDARYLEKDSLFGFLKGLERDNIEFWTDRELKAGELWDQAIKIHLQACDIALVLVSQGFLDSDYCRNVEIENFLAATKHLFPVILSPCDWKRHEWLASRQFLPGGDQTIEEHFRDEGERKRLFLKIREQLLERAQLIRQARISSEKQEHTKIYPPPDGQLTTAAGESLVLTRDVNIASLPDGVGGTLKKGERVTIHPSLENNITAVTKQGRRVRIASIDSDALGKEPLQRNTLAGTRPNSKPNAQFSGKTKIAFCNRLGEDWRFLADYLEITPAEQSRFTTGDEGRNIWVWLDNRSRLAELPDILSEINRPDLAQLFTSAT